MSEVQETRALLRQVPSDHVDAIARLPRDLAIIKMENDSVMALAAARPRDYESIQADLTKQIQAFPEFARKAMYRKPVGRLDKCPSCRADTHYREKCPSCGKPVPQKIARGLSIRAAEAARLSFGFTKLTQTVTDDGGDIIQLDTVLVDYQTGNVTQKSFPVSKTFKKRGGEVGRHPDDRFYDVVLKAKASIAARDTILTIIPAGMKASIEEAAIKAQAALLDRDAIVAIVAAFKAKGVSVEQLESHVGNKLAAFTNADGLELNGLLTAIEDGETTVDEVFGPDGDGADQPTTAPQGLAETLQGQNADEPPKRGRGRPRKEGTGTEQSPTDQPPTEDPAKKAEIIAKITSYTTTLGARGGDAQGWVARMGLAGKKLSQCSMAELAAALVDAEANPPPATPIDPPKTQAPPTQQQVPAPTQADDPTAKAEAIAKIQTFRTQIKSLGGDNNEVLTRHGFSATGTKKPTDCTLAELKQIEIELSEHAARLAQKNPPEAPPSGDWFGQ